MHKMNQEAREILLSLVCGGGVGFLVVLILEKSITADVRFIIRHTFP